MTKEIFDKAAADWDEKPQRVELSRRIVEAIKNNVSLTQEMRALEIGCGTGLLTVGLAPDLKGIVATDSSPGMIEVLETKIKSNNISNIETKCLDIAVDDTASVGISFELIYSGMVFHHIQKTRNVLEKCRDLLDPGGLLLIADLDKEDGSFHGDMEGVAHHGFQKDKFGELVAGFGFENISFSQVHIINKEDNNGNVRQYPVFLMKAMRSKK
ncbi:MAG: class I SAM-dependent methyltransferase [Desulfobulbaceae bacterium]|nr:class I SAM-dependent methyltransferase [Desulfobulbaceae bacterium]